MQDVKRCSLSRICHRLLPGHQTRNRQLPTRTRKGHARCPLDAIAISRDPPAAFSSIASSSELPVAGPGSFLTPRMILPGQWQTGARIDPDLRLGAMCFVLAIAAH
jgi:hypothetical protein